MDRGKRVAVVAERSAGVVGCWSQILCAALAALIGGLCACPVRGGAVETAAPAGPPPAGPALPAPAAGPAQETQALSPEAQWETVLEQNLGSFYLPRYKEAKAAGQTTAWDFVQDDPKLPRVLLIGDSISRGYTVSVRQALAGKANVHRIPCISTKASGALGKLDLWLGTGRWDVIHFNFGIHDRKTFSENYAVNLEKVVGRLKQAGASLIWASSTPLPETGEYAGDAAIVERNTIASEIMKRHGVRVNDLYGLVKPRQTDLQLPDDCHFREDQYPVLGEQVAQAISEALKALPGGTVPGAAPAE